MAFFGLFGNNRCTICKRKIKPLKSYINDEGKTIKLCLACTEYAERRAYKLKR